MHPRLATLLAFFAAPVVPAVTFGAIAAWNLGYDNVFWGLQEIVWVV